MCGLCIFCNVLVWIFVFNILIPPITFLEHRKAWIIESGDDFSNTSLILNLMFVNSRFISCVNYPGNCLRQQDFLVFILLRLISSQL